jgi:D-mannonate dehydratase
MDLAHLRTDIEQRRRQIERQRREIRELARAGISTVSAEALLDRMLAKVDELCLERDRQLKEERRKYAGTDMVINGPIARRYR